MKKFIGWFIFLLFVFMAGFIFMKFFFTYSEGSRGGLLQKISKKGVVFKTYEGEMILSSIRSNANMALASEKFFFSVPEETVAKKLGDLQGEFIVVFYKEKKGALPWVGETRYLVDSVKIGEHNPYQFSNPVP